MDLVTRPRGGTALTAGLGIGGKQTVNGFVFDGTDTPMKLSGAQKAAVIVQMIVDAGGTIPLSVMSEATQVHLARVYASMGPINKSTVAAVLDQFATHLDAHGLSFPVDTSAALDALEGNLSEGLLARMRQVHSPTMPKNTWETIADLPAENLAERITSESARIGAIILSKLPSAVASTVMELLKPDTANAVTFAISQTALVKDETVDIVAQTILDTGAVNAVGGAFKVTPETRAANLLNAANGSQRDAILSALDKLDAVFAAQVRKSIFTFADILTRIAAEDVGKLARALPADEMNAALKAGQDVHSDVVDFILSNLSSRMADQLREELSEMSPLSGKPAEVAMGKLTGAIRQLVETGEMTLLVIEQEEDA